MISPASIKITRSATLRAKPFLGEVHHHVKHFVDHFRVKRRGRFVKEHADGVHGERASDGDALLLAAGHLTRELVGMLQESDTIKELKTTFFGFFTAAAEDLHLGENEVFADRQVREELEVLEHHAHAAAQLRQIRLRVAHGNAVDDDLALLEGFERIDRLDERRLARARRAANDDDFTLFDVHGTVLQHLEVAIPLADVLNFNHCHGKFS